MKIGIIGLGKMGYSLALQMRDKRHIPIAYNRSSEKVDRISEEGVEGAYTLEELVSKLDKPAVILIMISAGEAVDATIDSLAPLLHEGDIVMDGGNSHYKDTLMRYEWLKELGIHYVDIGTSGGMEGARNGACMMVGGDEEPISYVEALLKDLCVEEGYAHVGPSGAGHYAKMVHNGIEYGMMQSIGEGFEILSESDYQIDFQEIARLWQHGSVIRGWLMELTEQVFTEHQDNLDDIVGVVNASGEGQWAVEEAVARKVSAPAITSSLYARYRSQQTDTFSGKLLAGLRFQFGGHKMETK